MKSFILSGCFFACSLVSLGAVEAAHEPSLKAGLFWLGIFVGGIASVLALITSTQKVFDGFSKRRERWLENRLSAHCPVSHESIRQTHEETYQRMEDRLTALQSAFGSEVGQLKNLVIEKSPNGRLDKLIASVDKLQKQMESSHETDST